MGGGTEAKEEKKNAPCLGVLSKSRDKGDRERGGGGAGCPPDAFRNCAPRRTATPATPGSTIEKGKHVGPQRTARTGNQLSSRALTFAPMLLYVYSRL